MNVEKHEKAVNIAHVTAEIRIEYFWRVAATLTHIVPNSV
jgi:hypothetical protein